MVTNFFVLNFLRTILLGGILDLLIKSHSPRLFMPVALFCLVLSDKGFVANDTIRYRITLNNCDHLGTRYMPFKKLHSPTTFVVHPGLPEDWNFLTFQEIHSPFQYQWIYGLAIILASVGSVSLLVLYGNDNNGIVTLFVFGILLGFPLSIYWLKHELDWNPCTCLF